MPSTAMYVELHARSAFSFLEGASLPEALVATGGNLNMPAMALLDRDGVFGSPRFYMAAKKIGLKAHIGVEITCQGFPPPQQKVWGAGIPGPARNDNSFRLSLLVRSRLGYQNLCRLITKMKLRAKKGEGAALPDELQEHAAGLICLTGGEEGPLAAALANGGMAEARPSVERLTEIFGRENVAVELQRHFHRPQEARNRASLEIARSLQLPASVDPAGIKATLEKGVLKVTMPKKMADVKKIPVKAAA